MNDDMSTAEYSQKLKQLRDLIKEGDDSISRGEVSTLTSDKELDSFFEKL